MHQPIQEPQAFYVIKLDVFEVKVFLVILNIYFICQYLCVTFMWNLFTL